MRGRPFQPGQSGNPSGRPKKTSEEKEVEALARQLAPEALRTLAEIMRAKKAPGAVVRGAARGLPIWWDASARYDVVSRDIPSARLRVISLDGKHA